MKVEEIFIYQVHLPIPGGGASVGGAKTPETVESTIAAVETDAGLVGWGENCPFGVANSPSCGTIFNPAKNKSAGGLSGTSCLPTFASPWGSWLST